MGKFFGREPAVLVAAFGALLQLLTAFGLNVDAQLQSILTAVAATLLGLFVAIQVGDGVYAAVSGLVQAGISLFVYYGLDWSAEDQAKNLAAVMLIVSALFVRPSVTAPVPADVSPPGKLVA